MRIKGLSLHDAIKVPKSPFPGLRPFEFDESHLFFGRDGQVEKMIEKLARTRFLAVVGASGSGKSSLVRAGLLPALYSGLMPGVGSGWRIALMRPTNNPIGNLARSLSQQGVFGFADSENAALQAAITEATLWRGSRGLIETVLQNAMPPSQNLIVVVDQFEELFRFAREARKANDEDFDNQAAAFVKLLLQSVKPNKDGRCVANIFVVLTMRSDFLGDCSQFWELPEAINESQYLIPRLGRDQLREVIVGPVALGGAEITDRLVTQLLNEIGDDQDQLPILQHAMMRTWDEWKLKGHDHQADPGVIDVCCYEKIGGMGNALSNHADEALEELDDRHKDVAEKLFKCLTEKGEDNREIRRPVTLDEICEVAKADENEVKTVIETYRHVGRSFLMPPVGTQLNSDTLIDISHESLIRVWKRLQGWVNEEAESAAIYRRLVEAARLRAENKGGELWRGADLQAGLEWREKHNPTEAWARRYQGTFKDVMDFLDASEADREREIREKEELRKKEEEQRRKERLQKIRNLILVVFVFLAVVLTGLLVYAIKQRNLANHESRRLGHASKALGSIVPLFSEMLYDDDDTAQTFDRLNQSLAFYQQSGNLPGEGVVLASVGELNYRIGEYQEAEEKYKAALSKLESTLGTENVYIASLRTKLAMSYSEQGKYSEAGRIFRENQNIQTGADLADTLIGLALMYQKQGYEKAGEADDLEEQAENAQDKDAANKLKSQAEEAQSQVKSKYSEAQKIFTQALDIHKAILGSNHQQVGVDLNYLATLYYRERKYKDAIPIYEEAHQIFCNIVDCTSNASKEKVRGQRYLYLSLASVLKNLASAYSHVAREEPSSKKHSIEKAGQYFSEVLKLQQKLSGDNDPKGAINIADACRNLALFHLMQGKYSDAEQYYKQAEEIRKKYPNDSTLAGTVEETRELLNAFKSQNQD